MSRLSLALFFGSIVCCLPVDAPAQWMPHYELRKATPVSATGSATTTFTLPNDPRVVGLRIYVGSVTFQLAPSFRFLAVSNST